MAYEKVSGTISQRTVMEVQLYDLLGVHSEKIFGERYGIAVSRCLLPDKRTASAKMQGVCMSCRSKSITCHVLPWGPSMGARSAVHSGHAQRATLASSMRHDIADQRLVPRNSGISDRLLPVILLTSGA